MPPKILRSISWVEMLYGDYLSLIPLISGESAFDCILSIDDIFVHPTGDETVGER
jgi:hypothetical protein